MHTTRQSKTALLPRSRFSCGSRNGAIPEICGVMKLPQLQCDSPFPSQRGKNVRIDISVPGGGYNLIYFIKVSNVPLQKSPTGPQSSGIGGCWNGSPENRTDPARD